MILHVPAHVTLHVPVPLQSIFEPSPALTTHSSLPEQSYVQLLLHWNVHVFPPVHLPVQSSRQTALH